MVIRYWWMIFVWLGLIALVTVLARVLRNHPPKFFASKKHLRQVAVAHSHRLNQLPGYKARFSLYRSLVLITAVLLLISISLSVLLTLRVSSRTVLEPEKHNRDIVLCLDVSGSMTETDQQLVDVFSQLTDNFKGERIALTVFDSSSSTIFPLTDDYDFVKEQLKTASQQLDPKSGYSGDSIFTGVMEGDGSSLIGDGLASCVMRFDSLDTKRSRSIILATDNYTNGAQIVDLKQAGAYAKDKGVRVYGLNPSGSAYGYESKESKDFKDVVMATDGGYYLINYSDRDDKEAIAQIVQKVQAQEATRFKGSPVVVVSDAPLWLSAGTFVAFVAVLVLLWRLRL